MLKIWGRANSSNVQKVLWCCAELGLKFERVDWGGPFGGNDDPAYRALNPNGKVPTLEDDGTVIWESNTILRYLCARQGTIGLHPSDPKRRSEVERWMDWQLGTLSTPMAALLFGYYRTAPEKRNAAALEAARRESIGLWSIVERHLEGRDFLGGQEFSLADVGTGILAHRWHNFPIERPALPRLKAWYERLRPRPAYARHVLAVPIN